MIEKLRLFSDRGGGAISPRFDPIREKINEVIDAGSSLLALHDHEVKLERYTEDCSSCSGHSRAKIVCTCGWESELFEIGRSFNYDLDFRLKRIEHLLGVV